ncbi:hypothetical protein D3C73_1255510 [compost metagenome]
MVASGVQMKLVPVLLHGVERLDHSRISLDLLVVYTETELHQLFFVKTIGRTAVFCAEIAVGGDQGFRKVIAGQTFGADCLDINLNLLAPHFFGGCAFRLEPFAHQLEILSQNEVKIFVAVDQSIVQIENHLLCPIFHVAHSLVGSGPLMSVKVL